MSLLVAELRDIHQELQVFVDQAVDSPVQAALNALDESANAVGKSWGHSWLGYQSKVYYEGFNPPPPGAHFSSEWGFFGRFQGTTGHWREFDFEAVREEIIRRAGTPDLSPARETAKTGEKLYEEKRDQIVSILETVQCRRKDAFIERLLEDAKKPRPLSASDYIAYLRPSGTQMSRDTLALTQGLWTPPHISVLAEVMGLRLPVKACEALANTAQKAASHVERVERDQVRAERAGTNVFIGHGRSPVWKDLKDFIQDRLHLPWDEFNRVPVAGITNIARLSEMLNAAAIAFMVMTAEDEHADGQMRARMNVIHEAGLFQGRLGFTKAVVLLEDGCEEFSNIQGLGQTRFPRGNIKAVFEEIRRVLEREGLLES